MDDSRKSFLRDLERALLEAISESAEVHRTLERMHRDGFRLQLFVDCQPLEEGATGNESTPPAPEIRTIEPAFRINGDDLVLLRGLGIDPTRQSRART